MFSIYADGNNIYDPSIDSYYLFEPNLKLEFGKSGSLEFTVPPTNLYYGKFKQLKTQIVVDMDGEEIFRGRVFSIERGFNNFKKVYCEGDLAYLVDSVQKAEKYNGKTRALFNKIIASHNARVEDYKKFVVGTVNIENRNIILTGKDEGQDINVGNIDYKQIAINSMTDEWNTTFDYIQNCLIDYCGGYLRTRRYGNVTYIDYLASYASAASQTIDIEFGKNLLDLTEEASAEDLFTVLVPIGDENLTINSVNKGSDEIVDTAAVKKYGRIVRTHVFSNVNDANTLLENGRRYLAENSVLNTSLEVKAIDIHLLDPQVRAIHVGDQVKVKSAPHGISDTLVCTAIEYDFANPENNTYTFGNPKQTLTQRYREDKRKNVSDASGAGAAGAAAADVAKQDAENAAQKAKDEIYEEWIDIDPDNPDGIGSLGGLYKLLQNGKEVLEKQVGIDFNAKEGNINLYALAKEAADATGAAKEARADFAAKVDYVNGLLTSQTEMVATYKEDVNGVLRENEAKWYAWANAQETVIGGKADRLEITTMKGDIIGEYEKDLDAVKEHLSRTVGIKWDASAGKLDLYTMNKVLDAQGKTLQQNQTKINQISNNMVSQITLKAEFEKRDKHVAEIEVTANENASAINLKADTVTVEGDFKIVKGDIEALSGRIGKLEAKKITTEDLEATLARIARLAVNNLTAASISAPSISMTDQDGGSYLVATQNYVNLALRAIATGGELGKHYHGFRENADGTITLLEPTSTPQSFNIKATKTYIDGVAAASEAANVTRIQIAETANPNITYSKVTKLISFNKKAIAFSGSKSVYTEDPVSMSVSGREAYEHGLEVGAQGSEQAVEEARNNVGIKSISVGKTLHVGNTASENYVSLSITATTDYGKTLTDNSQEISGATFFNRGKNSVEITAINRRTVGGVTEKYDPAAHTTTIYVTALASNNFTLDGEFTTGTAAWSAGKDQGEAEGIIKGKKAVDITDLTITEQHSVSDKIITITATAIANNDKTLVKSKPISTLVHYNKGKIDYTPKSVDVTVNTNGYTSSTKKLSTNVAVKTGNNTVYNFPYDVAGGLAYNAGVADALPTGVDISNRSVSGKTQVSTITSSTQFITAYKTITVKNSNNPALYTFNTSVSVNAADVWNAVDVNEPTKSGTETSPFNSSTKKYDQVKVTILSSSTNGKSKSTLFTLDASENYRQGVLAGQSQGRSSAIAEHKITKIDISASPASNTAGTDDYKKYNITAIARNANGDEKYTEVVKTSSTIYNRGYNAAKPTAAEVSINTDGFDSSTKKLSGNILVTKGDGTKDTFSTQVPAALAYNAAKPTAVNISISTGGFDPSTKKLSGNAVVTKGDGTKETLPVQVPGGLAYNAGKTAGKAEGEDSVYLSAVLGAKNGGTELDDAVVTKSNAVYTIDNNHHYVWGRIRTVLSNAKYKYVGVKISADDVYNTAYEQGKADGASESSPQDVSVSGPFIGYKYNMDGELEAWHVYCDVNGVRYSSSWNYYSIIVV